MDKAVVTFKIDQKAKDKLVRLAKADHRNLANYVELKILELVEVENGKA